MCKWSVCVSELANTGKDRLHFITNKSVLNTKIRAQTLCQHTEALCVLAESQISQATHLSPALHTGQTASRHGPLHPVLDEVPCLGG